VNAIKAIRVIGKLGNKNAYELADLSNGFAAGSARQGKKEVIMGDRLSGAIITAAVAAAVISTVVATPITQTFAQIPAASGAVPKTSWGEPDLQGIWTDEFDTALQRPVQLANPGASVPARAKKNSCLFGSKPPPELAFDLRPAARTSGAIDLTRSAYVRMSISSLNVGRSSCYRGHVIALG
jgi:hypothetical protein